MTEPARITDLHRVGFLWALLAGAFLVFNAIYWPLHMLRAHDAPEWFMARAQAQVARGDRAAAIKTLQTGIRALRPPLAAPYAALEELLRAAPDEHKVELANIASARAFYEALDAPLLERGDKFRAAAKFADQQNPIYLRPKIMERAAALLAGTLGAALDLGGSGLELSYGEQLALLRAASGRLRDDGVIGATNAKTPVNILVQSGGGEGSRRQAHIIVEGRDWARPQRGFHVALIDGTTGRVSSTSSFDIWDSADDAARMAEVLDAAQAGTIGAFAVFDDASGNITPELEVALGRFGCVKEAIVQNQPALLGPRYAFAAIGVKGATPGSAMQAWSPFTFTLPQDGQVHLGHPVVCGVLRAKGAAR